MSVTVTICVASLNTRDATELCVRSIRRFAGYPYSLVVGDGGSTDGSVNLLSEFEERGWLHLERLQEQRSHAEWLDRWREICRSDLLLFVDSDVEFRRRDWLHRIVAATESAGAAITYAEWLDGGLYLDEGQSSHVLSRPAPWMLMIDQRQTHDLASSFGVEYSNRNSQVGLPIIRDVGTAFFEEATRRRLPTLAMPASYRRTYHHYGGLSWLPSTGSRGQKKLRDQRVVSRRLCLMRRVQSGAGVLSRLAAAARLAALPQDACDLLFRIRARLLRDLPHGRSSGSATDGS
jgi:glycosyltransferase involved in cell wall biosynthesis